MLLFINEDGVDESTPQANNSSVWLVSVGGWLRFSDFPCRKIPFALLSDLSFQSSLHLQRLRRSDVKMDGGGAHCNSFPFTPRIQIQINVS